MATKHTYTCTSKLFLWPGETAQWYFLPVPKEIGATIKEAIPQRNGFGSIQVAVTVGDTTWQTSIFPEKTSRSFLLPV